MIRWYLGNPELAPLLERGAEARARCIRSALRGGAVSVASGARTVTRVWRRVAAIVVRRVAAWRRRRRTAAALQRLDNRTLRDIGVDRSEIHSLAHEQSAPEPGRAPERLLVAATDDRPANDNRRRVVRRGRRAYGRGPGRTAVAG